MTTLQLTGHIDENGHLQVDQPVDLPPGEVFITIEMMTPEEEAADDTKWDASFARSQDLLDRMADQALANLRAGLTQELDPDNL